MKLTFFKQPNIKQMTFMDLIKNPYITFDDIPNNPQKKITVDITDEYGRDLYNKRYRGLFLPDMSIYDGLNVDNEYRSFTIPKKSNPHKRRHIDAPSEILKSAQTIYKTFIEDTLKVQNHNAAYAYTKGRSVVTKNQKHADNESKWFLDLDLKNFFNSIDETFLRKMLLEVYPFKYIPEEHFNRIIKLSLFKGVLPQGSVLSPTLTNILMVPIDDEINKTLTNYNKHHYVYTRYADDITISSKQKFNPNEIIQIIKHIFDSWDVPFVLHDEKTKFTSINGKNFHCGININYNKQTNETKLSKGHKANDCFRAMINNFCKSGNTWEINEVQKFLGQIAWAKNIEPNFVKNTLRKYEQKYNMNIIATATNIISHHS